MKHLFLALTNPIPGREDDFNRWYDNHHLQEVLRYGNGFSSGRRYKLDLTRSRPSGDAWAYLALYALESHDLGHFHRHPWIENRPALTPFTGLLADDHVGWVYTPAVPAVGSEATLPPTGSPNLLFLLSASQSGKDGEQRDIIDGRIEGMAKTQGLLLAQRYELARHFFSLAASRAVRARSVIRCRHAELPVTGVIACHRDGPFQRSGGKSSGRLAFYRGGQCSLAE
jgi:hypothetical protein